VPEDRAGKGVFLDATVETNISASVLDRISPLGFLQRSKASERALQLATRFQIDPRRLPSEVSQLSGGNQQKVAIAKAVALDPCVLVLNEPTRGVDIGARSEIYKQLRELAASASQSCSSRQTLRKCRNSPIASSRFPRRGPSPTFQ